jgi:hypothetical protein
VTEHLNVLLLESERGAGIAARNELRTAGHTVVRCHEPGAAAFPCNAIAYGRRCPLVSHTVDVALVVRPRPRAQPAPQEDGVTCAIKHHVPLVVAGPRVLDPFEPYASAVLDRTYDVVDACERAAHGPLPDHTRIAASTLRTTLDARGVRASPLVSVTRRRGCLVVDVSNARSVDRATRDMAAVRMTAALRAFDVAAKGIDVVFNER